jgi:N-acyl-D-aspartate/D-glutamate deacylase
MSTDLIIRGGTVIDGTGEPGVLADVTVVDGRISAIGPDLDTDDLEARGAIVLDATGAVVAPGFIDIHTHYDAQVFWDPALSPSCFHGVTTVVAGNCGFSIAPTRADGRELIARTLENVEDMNVASLDAGIPWDFATFPEYLASVERHGVGLNFAAYIGHTALRLYVMGEDAYERSATAEEIAEMQQVLREAMEAGAAGLATSFAITHRGIDGKPVPSRFADRAEIEALLDVMAEVGRGVVVLLHRTESADELRRRALATEPPVSAKVDLRNYGIGAQILRDLNVGKMRLMARPRKMPSMTGFDLEVTGYIEQPRARKAS